MRQVITDPVARTRALYKWEREMVEWVGYHRFSCWQEICHAAHAGSIKNPHSVGFVKLYIDLLSDVHCTYKQDYEWLVFEAKCRGLL